MKTQTIRLLDVFVFGPVIIYAGTQRTLPGWLRAALVVIGTGTIVYNGINYMTHKKTPTRDGV